MTNNTVNRHFIQAGLIAASRVEAAYACFSRTVVSLILICLLAGVAQASGAEDLARYHIGIAEKFETVKHLKANKVETLDTDNLVVFDVREQDEYDVSHLENAIRVDPDISTQDFMQKFGKLIKTKTLLFYCAVGYRSSSLASSVQEEAISADTKIFNLEGGIFNWHNEQRSLVNNNGESNNIHPYNSYWGRFLEHPELIRY